MLQDVLEQFKSSAAYKRALEMRAEFREPAIVVDIPTEIVALSERTELYALCKACDFDEAMLEALSKPCERGFVHVLVFLPKAALGRVALPELS